MRAYAVIFAAVALAGALGWSHRAAWKAGFDARSVEVAAEVERSRAAAARAAEIASRKEAERLAAEDERGRLAAELEDLARADAVGVPECLSADRVRRLNAR